MFIKCLHGLKNIILGLLLFSGLKLSAYTIKLAFEDSYPHQNLEYKEVFENISLLETEDFSKKEILSYKQKLKLYSIIYMKEAKKRDVIVNNPLWIYKFSMKDTFHKEKLQGYCDKHNAVIFLDTDFTELDFLHELGHCDFNYHHVSDIKLINEGQSSYVMNWLTSEERYKKNRKEMLDNFFNNDNHHSTNSRAGELNHLLMIAQIKTYKLIKNNPFTDYVKNK